MNSDASNSSASSDDLHPNGHRDSTGETASMKGHRAAADHSAAVQFPLRWILVVPFVLQTFAAVGITGYLSIRNGQRAVTNLSNQLMDTTMQQVHQHLEQYLSVPIQVNRTSAFLLEEGIIDHRDFERLGHYFWQQNKAHSALSYAGFTLSSGEYIGAGEWLEDYGVLIDEADADGNTVAYVPDEKGDRTEIIYEYEYRATEEDWYALTIAREKPTWTVSIEDVEPMFVAAGLTHEVYASDGVFLGVVNADLVLSHISEFLQLLVPGDGAQLFIMERDGNLVASSDSEGVLHISDTSIDRVNSLDSDNLLTQTTAQYLQQLMGDFGAIQATSSSQFDIQGESYFVQVTPWQDAYGLDLLLVAVIPEALFTAEIAANTQITIYLCLAALAGAIAMGLITSYQITRPVLNLSHASHAIATAAREQHPQLLNHNIQTANIKELSILATSFQQMRDQLQQSFTALEKINAELEDRVEERTADLSEAIANLKRTQAQLVQTEKMSGLGRMTAGIAHEINNPINFISGNLSPLRDYAQSLLDLVIQLKAAHPELAHTINEKGNAIDLEFIQNDLPELLASMEIGTKRVQEIVQSVQNFSRLDEAEVKAVDLHEGIESTLLILKNLLKPEDNSYDIQVVRNYGTLPLVECHPGRVNQVFMNLLSNAIDALHEAIADPAWASTNPCPTITIQTTTQTDGFVAIAIADNGKGLADSARPNLFDPFFTTKPVGKGTGLGLYISYQIITETHQGTLTYESTPGEGTQFMVRLPITARSS
jgi:signal transduction histidine kinase